MDKGLKESLPFLDSVANPAATRLPSAMSRSALSSLPKGSGRMELVEVKLRRRPAVLRFMNCRRTESKGAAC